MPRSGRPAGRRRGSSPRRCSHRRSARVPELTEAYQTLTDPASRAKCDATLVAHCRQMRWVLCDGCGQPNRAPRAPLGQVATCQTARPAHPARSSFPTRFRLFPCLRPTACSSSPASRCCRFRWILAPRAAQPHTPLCCRRRRGHLMNQLETRALRLGLKVKFTQARLGLLVGVHGCTIGRWERGIQHPRPSHRELLQQMRDQAESDLSGEAVADRARTGPRTSAPQPQKNRAAR